MTNILIVDDDASLRAWLSRILESLHYDVDVATDGREALRCLDRKSYSLLLIDLLMPVVSGFELLEALGKREMEIPTIIMSALVLPEVHQYLKTHEKVRILSKPFSDEQLQEAIESLIGNGPDAAPRKRKPRKK